MILYFNPRFEVVSSRQHMSVAGYSAELTGGSWLYCAGLIILKSVLCILIRTVSVLCSGAVLQCRPEVMQHCIPVELQEPITRLPARPTTATILLLWW